MELTHNIRQYSSYKYGWVIKRGQKYITKNNEEGARHQNFEAEKRETLSQVGRHETPESGSEIRSKWFDDETREIWAN